MSKIISWEKCEIEVKPFVGIYKEDYVWVEVYDSELDNYSSILLTVEQAQNLKDKISNAINSINNKD